MDICCDSAEPTVDGISGGVRGTKDRPFAVKHFAEIHGVQGRVHTAFRRPVRHQDRFVHDARI